MTDSEKLALIDTMIADFWEYMTEEQQEKGGCCFSNCHCICWKLQRKGKYINADD